MREQFTSCNQPKEVPEPEIQAPRSKELSVEWMTVELLGSMDSGHINETVRDYQFYAMLKYLSL